MVEVGLDFFAEGDPRRRALGTGDSRALGSGEMRQFSVLFPLVGQASHFAAQTLDRPGLKQQEAGG